MLQKMQHPSLGLLQKMQPRGPNVAARATSKDEGTRPPDEGTRQSVARIRCFDERTRAFANEPGILQVIDMKEYYAVPGVSSRNTRTRGAKVPDEPGRRLLWGPVCGRNTIRERSP